MHYAHAASVVKTAAAAHLHSETTLLCTVRGVEIADLHSIDSITVLAGDQCTACITRRF
jgi:hypothetical protein